MLSPHIRSRLPLAPGGLARKLDTAEEVGAWLDDRDRIIRGLIAESLEEAARVLAPNYGGHPSTAIEYARDCLADAAELETMTRAGMAAAREAGR